MPASGPAKPGTLSGTTAQPVSAKRAGVAIGVDDDAGALRRQRRQHAVEDGDAADLDARLVAAAHAARQAAGEHQAEGGGIGSVILV